MRCPSCSHENRDDAGFCASCGSRLALTCARCGRALPPSARFCDGCGTPIEPRPPVPERDPRAYTPPHLADRILTLRSALEGERKHVTVLFADVQGSMELAGRVDPETWHGILDRFFTILADGVHRFEGTINQYTGDGIMALFGAPLAHEDHGRRACYAALHLTEELRHYARALRREQGVSFSVRMGLNSGEVVVGKIGDDLRMDYTAQGNTVGLAQRMEQLCEPGRAYLTDHTARLVAGFFELEDLGAFTVKGIAEPTRVWALEGVGPLRTRLEVAGARGFSRFVGRDTETASIDAALERTLEGHGQVVGVVGEPGVGKSRLCFEFTRRCLARGIAVHETHALPHGRMIPFLPVLELLRSYFGVSPEDTDQAAREKIAGRLLLLDQTFETSLPLMFEFLGVPDPDRPTGKMSGSARQRQLFATMRRVLHARSRHGAQVLLVEDLHWIDGGSEAFLADLVEALPGTRTLLLVNFRPEYHAPWMQRSYYQQLALQPLGPEAIAELLRDLLGEHRSLDGLPPRIRARTGGNPFFIEEVVHALAGGGSLVGTRGSYRLRRPVEEVAIPATVQAVLAARIDRLGESEKLVLQTAAVIGRKFTEPVLQRVAELPPDDLAARLRALVAAEFVYERALYPEAQYAFKHPLTQEVAYATQLASRRARTHAAVAKAIAELEPDKLERRAALLAHHWEGAGERLEAARWSRRAAQWVGLSDPAEAMKHWRNVRTLVGALPESEETNTLALAACTQILNFSWRLGLPDEETSAIFVEGKRLAEQRADKRELAKLMNRYGTVQRMAGKLQQALDRCTEADRLGASLGDDDLLIALRPSLVAARFELGQLAGAVGMIEEKLELARQDPRLAAGPFGYNPYIWLLAFHGTVINWMGRLGDADRELEQAIQLAREHGELDVLCWTHVSYVDAAQVTGDTAVALSHALHVVDVAERMGTFFARLRAYYAFGCACLLREEWTEAVTALEHALAIHREGALGLFEASTLARLAEAYLGRGEVDRARRTAEEAVAVGQHRGTAVRSCEAQLALGRVLLHGAIEPDWRAVDGALRLGLAHVRQTGAVLFAPMLHLELAEAARRRGDDALKDRELAEARRLFETMGATERAARVGT